jgi:hypothetical protein
MIKLRSALCLGNSTANQTMLCVCEDFFKNKQLPLGSVGPLQNQKMQLQQQKERFAEQ